jgi:hypothetical protein
MSAPVKTLFETTSFVVGPADNFDVPGYAEQIEVDHAKVRTLRLDIIRAPSPASKPIHEWRDADVQEKRSEKVTHRESEQRISLARPSISLPS